MNYFELYGIPVQMKPDNKLVRSKFYELSRQYHPDFFSQSTSAEQAEALSKSSEINKAFKTFQSPDETIRYVLQLHGMALDEEKFNLDPMFLAEVMDINEQLMDLEGEADSLKIAQTEEMAKQLQNELYTDVAAIIENYNHERIKKTELEQVKEYYYKKKYLQRILDRIGQIRNIALR